MRKIIFVKKFFQLFLILNIFGFCVSKHGLNSVGFAYYDSFRNSRIVSEKQGDQKGFVFKMEINKDYENEKLVNFVDFVVRSVKKLAKNEFDDEKYAEKLFDRYKVYVDGNKYVVKFYVYPEKSKFNSVKTFVKKKLLGKSVSDLFGNVKKDEFDDYVEDYVEKFKKSLKEFIRKINSLYNEDSYERMYDIFKNFDRGDASSDKILTALPQNKKIMRMVDDIKRILKDLDSSKYKYKYKYKVKKIYSKYDDDDYDYDYDDDDDDDEYLKDKRYHKQKKLNKALKNSISEFLNYCERGINKLKDLKYGSYNKMFKSIEFLKSVGIVKKEVKKIDGYLENISEY